MSVNSHEYVARRYIDKSDVEILVDSMKNHQNVLLLGPRGTGKSSLAAETARRLGIHYRYIPCHTGASSEVLIGQWIPQTSGGGYRWMDGVLTLAVRKGHICLLDEVNSLKPEVAFAIHGLLDHRRELVLTEKPGEDGEPETVSAHPNFGLIAAGNPYYEGVRVMNEAFRDRFPVQITMGYHQELDVAILRKNPVIDHLSTEMAVALEQFIAKVRGAVKTGAIHSDFSTRAFLDLAQNISVHTFQSARTMLLSRFGDDEGELAAIRTCFNEVWSLDGKIISPDHKAEEALNIQRKRTGRAGRFATNNTTNDEVNAKETF